MRLMAYHLAAHPTPVRPLTGNLWGCCAGAAATSDRDCVLMGVNKGPTSGLRGSFLERISALDQVATTLFLLLNLGGEKISTTVLQLQG